MGADKGGGWAATGGMGVDDEVEVDEDDDGADEGTTFCRCSSVMLSSSSESSSMLTSPSSLS